MYRAEAWGIKTAERRKVNVHQMKGLRSLVGVPRMDRVGNEEVRGRAGMERELASRAGQTNKYILFRQLGHRDRDISYKNRNNMS